MGENLNENAGFKKLVEKFGVWGEKQLYGNKYMGVFRTTFLIDKNGFIANVWNNVKITNHANDVLNFIESYL